MTKKNKLTIQDKLTDFLLYTGPDTPVSRAQLR